MASIAPQPHRTAQDFRLIDRKGGWPLFGRLLMWAVRNAR